MTLADALLEIDTVVQGWRADEIAALRAKEPDRAHECAVRIAALEYLREQIVTKALQNRSA